MLALCSPQGKSSHGLLAVWCRLTCWAAGSCPCNRERWLHHLLAAKCFAVGPVRSVEIFAGSLREETVQVAWSSFWRMQFAAQIEAGNHWFIFRRSSVTWDFHSYKTFSTLQRMFKCSCYVATHNEVTKIWIFKTCTFKVHFKAIVKYVQMELDEQCIFQFVWTEKLY